MGKNMWVCSQDKGKLTLLKKEEIGSRRKMRFWIILKKENWATDFLTNLAKIYADDVEVIEIIDIDYPINEFLNDNRIKYVENHAIEIIMKAEIKACAFLNRKVKEIKLSEETKEAIELGILTENQIDEQVVKTREDYFELTDSSYFELYYNGLYARKIAELEKVYQIQFLEDNG